MIKELVKRPLERVKLHSPKWGGKLEKLASRVYHWGHKPGHAHATNGCATNPRPYAYLGDSIALLTTAFGHKMFVSTRDISLTPSLISEGSWEQWITNFFLQELKPEEQYLEVGCNVGFFTLLAAARVGPCGTVLGFEANPSVYDLLSRSLEVNGFRDRAQVFNQAASNQEGTLDFYVMEKHQGSSSLYAFSDEYAAGWNDTIKKISCKSVVLDTVLEQLRITPTFIKVDAEGAEPLIFEGLARTLAKRRLRGIFEYSPSIVRGFGRDPRQFLESFERIGYKLAVITTQSTLIPIGSSLPDPAGGHADVFFCPA